MTKGFLIDLRYCSGCYNCQVVCKDEHWDQAWPPYAAPQPELGQFWCRIEEKERGQFPVTRVSYIPRMCAHCADAPCAKVAPEMFERRDDGLLILKPEPIDVEKAQAIADACPIGAIFVNEEAGLAQKCTGCAHLLDSGDWTVPRCVDACSTDALKFGDLEDLDLEGAIPMPGLEGAGARIFYKNWPKRFVAGLFYDSRDNEVVIGAEVSLLDAAGDVVATTETDMFGDFRFDQVEPACYTVKVVAEGFEPKTFEADLTEIDLYIGDQDLA